jgi:hypothetical protein
VNRDYPWVIGMLRPPAVVMARIDLGAMEAVAGQRGCEDLGHSRNR